MSSIVYVNGRFVPEDEAWLSVFDGGWLHGAGLFETLRVENGRVFRLEAHVRRLMNSAARLLHPLERTQLPDEGVFHDLLVRNGLQSARVRLTVSAGPMRNGPQMSDEMKLTVTVTTFPLSTYPERLYEEGVSVIVCPFKQSADDPIAGHKTTAYLPRLIGLREAQKARCTEALWFNTRNELAEGSISNVFLVKDGTLRTPPISTPVLPGITRAAILELSKGAGTEVQEGRLGVDDLLEADECLLTNTIMGVLPVIRVERHDFGGGKVGPVARRLRDFYRNLVRQECFEPRP
jgi:branched-chain amino acid aminotransferase